MFRKRLPIITAIVVALVLVGTMAVAASWHTARTPRGLGQFVLLIGTGEYDEADLVDGDDYATWFHEDIMGRTQQEIDALAEEADDYFWSEFGRDYDPDTLEAFGVDPRAGVRAFMIGGMDVPAEGFVVREGGFMAQVLVEDNDDGEVWGTVVYGEMVIQPRRAPFAREVPERMAIRYRTETPILRFRHVDLTAFEVILESDLWGDGRMQAMARDDALTRIRTEDVDIDTEDRDNDNDNGFLDWLLPGNNNNPNNQITPTPAPLETPPPTRVEPTIDVEEIGFWGLLLFPEAEDILEDIDPAPEPGFVPEPPLAPTPPPNDNNNNN